VHLVIAYLVALGNSCDCEFLITLGDYRHLDNWCFGDWKGDLVIVSAPIKVLVRGFFLPYSMAER
jgi:hypothetical protein